MWAASQMGQVRFHRRLFGAATPYHGIHHLILFVQAFLMQAYTRASEGTDGCCSNLVSRDLFSYSIYLIAAELLHMNAQNVQTELVHDQALNFKIKLELVKS